MARGALARAKKKALTEHWTVVFVDESCFRLLPALTRTYAPRGRRPMIRVKCTRDHLSVMGGITLEGRLLLRTLNHSFHQENVVLYLRHLLREIPGTTLVIWDGASIHKNRLVKHFVEEEAGGRIVVEPLPPYAPDLNPCEGVWNYLKNREMRNLVCTDLDALRVQLRRAIARFRHRHAAIRGCTTQARLV